MRLVLVLLLLGAAYLAALPWIDCWSGIPMTIDARWRLMGTCAVGLGIAGGGPEPHVANIVIALVYAIAAAWIARTRQTL